MNCDISSDITNNHSSLNFVDILCTSFATVPATPTVGSAIRISPTAIEVTWNPHSPEDSEGIISSYLVRLRIVPEEEADRIRARRNSDDLIRVMETNDTSLVVSDLDPGTVYGVSVAVRTSARNSSYSPETIVGCKLIKNVSSWKY